MKAFAMKNRKESFVAEGKLKNAYSAPDDQKSPDLNDFHHSEPEDESKKRIQQRLNAEQSNITVYTNNPVGPKMSN